MAIPGLRRVFRAGGLTILPVTLAGFAFFWL
jgi:hypothetical protein